MDFTRGEEASSFEASYWFCHARAFLVNKVVQTRLHRLKHTAVTVAGLMCWKKCTLPQPGHLDSAVPG